MSDEGPAYRFFFCRDSRAGKRAGRGTGTSGGDLFKWQRSGEARSIEDGRKGIELCKRCKADVRLVESPPGTWSKRDPESGFPHELSCSEQIP